MEYPTWYKSSSGPGMAATVQGIIGGLLPVINLILGQFNLGVLGDGAVNAFVSAIVFVGFSLYTAWGYVRAKRTLSARIAGLEVEVRELGGGANASTGSSPSQSQ